MTDSRSYSLRHDDQAEIQKPAGICSYDPILDPGRQFEWYGTYAGGTRKV